MSRRYFSVKKKPIDYNKVEKRWYDRNGKRFFAQSIWEYNYACYLDFLKEKGEIKDWDRCKRTFWFEKIKRGVRSYLPDFVIIEKDGSETYVEVKGYMDSKSKTKIKRMKKYYPDIKLIVVDAKQYRSIAKWRSLIKGWIRKQSTR